MTSHSTMILQIVLGKTYTFTMSNLPMYEQDVLGGLSSGIKVSPC